MPRTSIQTNLLGRKVTDGADSLHLTNRRLAYYGLNSPATISAVFTKEGDVCFLIVDDVGRSATVWPCQVTIQP